jgi:TetR/AcrR family transcriptional regulator, fatty acid metabolism regulator protein
MTIGAEGVSLRERQRQEREGLILRAAADLFVERGYHETSMEDIAAHVGIAKGTVYLHFASKEDLALAYVTQGARRFASALDTILASDETPRAKLGAVLDRTFSAMSENISQALATIFRNPEIIMRMRERHDDMSAVWREPMRRLSEVLNEGKALGEFDPDMPTPVMLNLLMSLIARHRWESQTAAEIPPAEIARLVKRFFFKGIAPDQPGQPARSDRPVEHAPPSTARKSSRAR